MGFDEELHLEKKRLEIQRELAQLDRDDLDPKIPFRRRPVSIFHTLKSAVA